jgi:hypothetical protein
MCVGERRARRRERRLWLKTAPREETFSMLYAGNGDYAPREQVCFGLHKTHLAHVAVATALNIVQLTSWLRGDAPEQTRTSAFKRVMKQAA